jgi:hypothetical protein
VDGIFARAIGQTEAKVKSQKLELWKRRRDAFQKSGSTLDYWFSRVREVEKSEGLVELKAQGIPTVKSCLEVVVSDRYRIEIRDGFNAQLFAELIKALESLG